MSPLREPEKSRLAFLTRRRIKRLAAVALPVLVAAALVLYGVLLLPGRPIAWLVLGGLGLLAYLLWRFR